MEYKYFPCTITPDNKKTPLISDWQALATSDPVQLQKWQAMFRERLTHWGLPTGVTTGIIALDIDVKQADKNGFQSIQDNNLIVPATTNQNTITGGRHYLYQYPNDGQKCGNRVGVHPGIDVRGEGGWIAVYEMDQTPLAPAPDWLIEASRKTFEAPQGEVIAVSSNVGLAKLEECLQEIYDTPEGERNHALNRQGFFIAQLVSSGAIEESVARDKLRAMAVDIGLDADEIKHTINSCIRGGYQKPLTSPFGAPQPLMNVSTTPVVPIQERWTPPYFSLFQFTDKTKLKKPQLFKNWSTQDLHITTADGGTGKTTLKLYEAVCLALGESFLGFECLSPGKTLYITGEDTADKLGAMLGAICRQMGVMENSVQLNTILSSIVVKKDSDLCVISKSKQNFLIANHDSLTKVLQAVDDIKPKMIIFDPISMFWGSESALNDMNLAVSKFMGELSKRSNACVELINHMGKQSSSNKDMSQFAGRGGTGLPSHARVSRVLRPIDEEEYKELTGEDLTARETAMMCNVSKFSDGSPLYNKPFLIVRSGFLFSRKDFEGQKVRDTNKQDNDIKRVFEYIKARRHEGQLPTKNVVVGHFMLHADKLSQARVKRAIEMLLFTGYGTETIRLVQGPDASISEKVIIVTDHDGKEL